MEEAIEVAALVFVVAVWLAAWIAIEYTDAKDRADRTLRKGRDYEDLS